MNKRLIVDLSILFLIIGFVLFFVLKKEKQEPDVGTPSIVGTFQYDDYKDRNLIDFPSARFLGPIPNAETAMAQAETIWTEIYGEQVKSKKPYQVFYDEVCDKGTVLLSHSNNGRYVTRGRFSCHTHSLTNKWQNDTFKRGDIYAKAS